MGEPYLWRTANMSRRMCVVVKQMQSNPIHGFHQIIYKQVPFYIENDKMSMINPFPARVTLKIYRWP